MRKRSALQQPGRGKGLPATHRSKVPIEASAGELRVEEHAQSSLVIRETGRVKNFLSARQRGARSALSPQVRRELELKNLSLRLLDIQEKERKRIARELHDGTAQNLFAMSMLLSRLIKENPDTSWAPLLEECLTLCEQSRREIRTLSYLLHPPMLHHAGLVPAMKWYVEGFSERSGIKVKLSVVGPNRRFSMEIEAALFRVVQECLANIHRHSGSQTASVKLRYSQRGLVLVVRDWGRGMVNAGNRSGVGIPGIRERISHLQGHLAIETGKRGTKIIATVPLRADEKDSILQDGKQKRAIRRSG